MRHIAQETPAPNSSALSDFQTKLQAYTLESLHEKQFVLLPRLIEWLRSSDRTSTSQVQRLLLEAYSEHLKSTPELPVTAASVSRNCLLVFSILLDIGHANLIDKFQEHKLVDHKLPINHHQLETWLQNQNITGKVTRGGDEVARLFHDAQWKFCAPSFYTHDANCFPAQQVLPIHRRHTINNKGGTAHLWEIEVPEEFVGEDLRVHVKDSQYESSKGYGTVGSVADMLK